MTSTTASTATTITRRSSSASDRVARARQVSVARRITLALLAAGCLVVSLQAARLGLSGSYSQLAHREAERSGAFDRAADEALRESLRYDASNPSALNLRGTRELAKLRASTNPREALAAANEARRLFREGLQRRPTSPFLWANLALSKIYLDEIDPEMLTALRNADTLGPWEPLVQEATVYIGLAAWHKLDSGMRESVARTVERAGRRNAGRVFAVLKGFGRQDLACKLPSYRSVIGTDCGGSGTTSRTVRR